MNRLVVLWLVSWLATRTLQVPSNRGIIWSQIEGISGFWRVDGGSRQVVVVLRITHILWGIGFRV